MLCLVGSRKNIERNLLTIKKKMEMEKTRKQAAKELMAVYNHYEVRKVCLKTIYNRIYKDGDAWRLVGYAHDYIV